MKYKLFLILKSLRTYVNRDNIFFLNVKNILLTINIKSRPIRRKSFDWPDTWSEAEWSGHNRTSAGLTLNKTDDLISTQGGQVFQGKRKTSGMGNKSQPRGLSPDLGQAIHTEKRILPGKKKMIRNAVCLDQKDFCEDPKG